MNIEYTNLNNGILFRIDKPLDINNMNNIITKELHNRGDLEINHTVERVVNLKDNLWLVDCYGTLTKEYLIDTLLDLSKKTYEDVEVYPCDCLYNGLSEDIKSKVAIQWNIYGSQKGGTSIDTPEIDKGIATLVEAINSIPNTKTFSSCDGHGTQTPYILWQVAGTQENAGNVIDIIETAMEEKYSEYFKPSEIRLLFHCGFGRWTNNKGIYYEIRFGLSYNKTSKEQLFAYIKDVSELIKDRK